MKKKKGEVTIRSSAAEYLTYVASVGDQQDSIEMRYENENIWLTQKMMATLYDIGLPTINEHIKKIYADSELEESEISQNEFATRMGTTAKTLSKLINGQANISNDLAKKLSVMLGTSVEVWQNLQNTYDQKLIEVQQVSLFAHV